KMWQERPEGQLEKCAEAAALRRAFPEEIGNELTAEEMTGKSVHELSMEVSHTASETIAPNRDAGPPRQVAPPAEPPQDPEQARDSVPPPRKAKAEAPKEDQISSGPPRSAPKENGPAEPPPKPYRIPGKDH